METEDASEDSPVLPEEGGAELTEGEEEGDSEAAADDDDEGEGA